jgi:fatty acid-binding protein DegV
MSQVALFVDSTTVMPRRFLTRPDVVVMPVPIYAAGREYRDGVDISPEMFLTILESSSERPSTAVPGLGEFVSHFEDLLAAHEAVIYPVPSHRLTGLYDAAVQAAEQVANAAIVAVDPPPDWKKSALAIGSGQNNWPAALSEVRALRPPVIALVNTGFASGASGLVAMAGLEALDHGEPLERALEAMIHAKRDTNILFILNTLEYIVDRVGQLQAFLGSLLKIKPILTFRDGQLEDVARSRGKASAKARMIELLRQEARGRSLDLYVLHSEAAAEAEGLLDEARGQLEIRQAWVDGIGASVSRYTGRGGLGLAYRLL